MTLFSSRWFSDISNLPEILNHIFCISKTELQYYPTLAGNELWVWNGAESPHEGGAMGKKIDDRSSREQWAKDFEVLASPYLEKQVPSFLCTAGIQFPDHGTLFPLYASLSKVVRASKEWSEQTDSLMALSIRYGSAVEAPNLSVISLQKHPESSSESATADYKTSFSELLEEGN